MFNQALSATGGAALVVCVIAVGVFLTPLTLLWTDWFPAAIGLRWYTPYLLWLLVIVLQIVGRRRSNR